MRCERCGYSSPENHKFCGMCGAKLSQAATSVAVDDNDPLDIEAPLREPLQFRELDHPREFARDAAQSSGPNGRTNYTSATVANLPPDTAEEAAAEEVRARKSKDRPTGIGGPSFLGLGYEGTNEGFVYDKPRDDGFVYDTDAPPPEYLLDEVPRGVSWRAWALFLLLLIGAGLGYVQWRASHHQGFPDVASILARNGPTVDPSGPDMRDNKAKPSPKAQAPAGDSSATDSANDSEKKASTSDTNDAKASSDSETAAASKESAESKNSRATDKTSKTVRADNTAKADETAADETSSKSAKVGAAKASEENSEEAAKPESDGPVAKATKATRIPPQPVEEAPQPKSLGEKDPLIVQANKYLRGRGAGKNCSAAVNLLRQASSAGNPSADVKMGALYWSGTCVTQSNFVAYQWFARAHALEPNNRWIERSRTSLWARLTPSERHRVGY